MCWSCYSLGAAAITFGLPMLLYLFALTCNDVAGCPVPSLLHIRSLTWERLKAETEFETGMRAFFSWKVTGIAVAYYVWSLLLWRVLPAREVHGTKLVHHSRPLTYRFNGKHAQHYTIFFFILGLTKNSYDRVFGQSGHSSYLCCWDISHGR